jgi:hypothetical protein
VEFRPARLTSESVSAHITAPVKDQLIVEVLAWSPGTNGTVTAPAFALTIPNRPTASDLSAYPGASIESADIVGRPAGSGARQPEPTISDGRRVAAPPIRQGGGGVDEAPAWGALSPFEVSRRIDEF